MRKWERAEFHFKNAEEYEKYLNWLEKCPVNFDLLEYDDYEK